MKAPLATSLSVLSRSLNRHLSAIKPLSPSVYLADALAAQRYRRSRSSADAGDQAGTIDGTVDSTGAMADSDSGKLAGLLCKQRGYRRVLRTIARRNRKHLRRSAAFVAESLRQVGVSVPRERVIDGLGVSQVTWALSRHLRDELGWQRVDTMAGLRVGDVVFTADSHCCPGIPHHVMVFMGWHDAARGLALVVDNRGFLVVRDLRASARGHHHNEQKSSTDDVDARFGYALRAPNAVTRHSRLTASTTPAGRRLAA